ncbi:unnamed protein product, partial [Staurois parvus]
MTPKGRGMMGLVVHQQLEGRSCPPLLYTIEKAWSNCLFPELHHACICSDCLCHTAKAGGTHG